MLNGLLRCFPAADDVEARKLVIGRIVFAATLLAISCALIPASAAAQDVPGIEICTVEKTMERRTSCLQSNVDFLQKTITRLGIDHQQKIDAANRQIETLKAAVVGLQKRLDELQPQKKPAEDKKAEPPAADGTKGGTK
jgi:outer membrane murein-binding lipoprotein Lpp